MLAVLLGPSEVLVIVILAVVIAFLVARRKG